MAAPYDFRFDAGADIVSTLTWTDEDGNPIDLTGCTAILTLKLGNAPDLVLTDTSGLTLGGTAGTISFDIVASETADWNLSVPYTLFITSAGGIVTKLMSGNFLENPS